MALMVVGFGLKDCIYEIVSLQYEKVQFYDAATYMSDDISEENRQQLHDYLDQNADIKETIEARMQKTDVKSASGKKTLYLMVPSDNEKIEDFLSFHSRTNKDEVYSLKKDEVILTEKMASLLNVKVGDELTIEDEDSGRPDGDGWRHLRELYEPLPVSVTGKIRGIIWCTGRI